MGVVGGGVGGRELSDWDEYSRSRPLSLSFPLPFPLPFEEPENVTRWPSECALWALVSRLSLGRSHENFLEPWFVGVGAPSEPGVSRDWTAFDIFGPSLSVV
jgi:hypothetical protein